MSAEPDYLPADALAEDEPKYLRRQKPVEIRKRKFSRKSWPLYRRILAGAIAALSLGALLYEGAVYLYGSPGTRLTNADQIEIEGNRFVTREAVVEKFSRDIGRSLVQISLDERRKELESLAWVEQAGVQRVLPNRIRVQITERAPVAFLRAGSELALVDAHGMILDRPPEGEFRFPVVAGIGETTPREEREKRMNLFVRFMKEIELARPSADDQVSEADLSDAADLRAIVTGLGSASGATPPVLVHFGDSDFGNRYHLLAENINQWRASAGSVDSVDLRFARQVVVNPEAKTVATSVKPSAPPRVRVLRKRRH